MSTVKPFPFKVQRIGEHAMMVPNPSSKPSVNYRAQLLSTIVESIDDHWWFCMHEEGAIGLPAKERYAYLLRWRVCRHLKRKLSDIQRRMNVQLRRRYVHWSNADGRYVDEGE